MTTMLRAAVLAGLAALAACSSPAREARLLQVQPPIVMGPPGAPGVDGPLGVVETGTPASPFTSPASAVRSTAALMAEAARRGPTFRDWRERPRLRKERPDRRQLPQHPLSIDALVREPGVARRGTGSLVAQTAASPNVDVATLADTQALPPDTMGDIGPAQYFVGLNGRMRTVAKATGAPDGVVDADSDVFFAPVLPSGHYTSDPRVRYDRRRGRWVVLMISVGVPNRVLLAMSSNAVISATTTWAYFSWQNTRTQGGGGSVACLADYPSLGIDEDALYIGVNQFCGGSLAFDSTSVYVVNKAALVNGTLSVSAFDGVLPTSSSPGLFTPQGVDNFDTGTDEGYVIGVSNTAFGELRLRRVVNPGGTPSLSSDLVIPVPNTGYPIDVPHPGSTNPLDGLDDRLLQAVVRNGRLWTTHQIQVDATGAASASGGRNGIRWYELENLATTPSLRQSGTVFDTASANPVSYWMGAIMPNGQGHVALGMSQAGATTSVNAAYTGRLASDPAGAMDAPTAYSAGSGVSYNLEAGTQRWGDYSYTSVDPDDDMTFWTVQQYVNATNSYAVRLVRLLAPPPPAIQSVSPSSLAAGLANATVTVTGVSADGRGFFDPGAGFARRIAASLGTGVSVTNVTVASPTSVVLTVSTLGAAIGGRTLTVTNPDGQVSTLASALTITAATPGPPVFSGVPANRTIFDAGSGATTGPLAFQVADPDGTPVVLTATSSNTTVIPAGRITLGGADTEIDRTVSVRSIGQYGSSTITLQATSGGQTTTASFVVTVSPSGVATPPQAFTVTVVRNRVTFAWQPPASASNEPVSSYRIEAGYAPGQTIAVLPTANVLSYQLFSAPDGVFVARVRAVTAAGVSPPSNEVAFAVGQGGPPLAPQALLATVQNTSVSLRWTENPLGPVITGYYLLAGTAPGLSNLGAIPLPATARSFDAVAPPGTYYVRVVAVNGAGPGAPTNEAVLVAQPGTCTIPAVPGGLAASAAGSRLSLAWAAPTAGAIPTAYQLRVGTAPGLSNLGTFGLPGDITAVSGIVASGPYYLRLAAANACGLSGVSAEVSATVP
jgi:hypothetical protein